MQNSKFTGNVVAAVIKFNEKYFIAKRAKKDSLEGLWEFPGGKQEHEETLEECLKRELLEEFNVVAKIGDFFCSCAFEHKNKKMKLLAFNILSIQGDFECREHSEVKWVSANELQNYSFPDPDLVIIEKIINSKNFCETIVIDMKLECNPLCKTGLKKNVIPLTVFKRELELCRNLFQENGGCSWGKCENCGVIPLLYKLHKGELLENSQDIKKVKKEIFKKDERKFSTSANNLKKSAQSVQDALDQFGLALVVKEFPVSTRTAQQAADAIGCEVAQIAKSLVFKGKNSGKPVLVIASGKNRVNEKRIAEICGEYIEKADADFVLEHTGFAIGGIPPVGHITPIKPLIDQDLLLYDLIWAAAGTPNAVFKLFPMDLVKITQGTLISVL